MINLRRGSALSIFDCIDCRHPGIRIDPADARLDLGKKILSAQTGQRQKRHLRMRAGIQARRVGAVPFAILSLRNHFPHLRRGNDFPAAVRRRVRGAFRGRFYSDYDFSFVAGGRVSLGLDERSFDVEVRIFLNLNLNHNRNPESEIKSKIRIKN